MNRFIGTLLGVLLRITNHAKIFRPDGLTDSKPKIYISSAVSSGEKTAIVNALKCSVVLSRAEYLDDAVIRTINSPRVILDDGGFNTEWLHAALKVLKKGGSVLIFPADSDNSRAVLISLMSGAEIVPLYSRPQCGIIKRHRVTVGAPIPPGGNYDLSAEWVNSEIKRVNKAMSAIKGV